MFKLRHRGFGVKTQFCQCMPRRQFKQEVKNNFIVLGVKKPIKCGDCTLAKVYKIPRDSKAQYRTGRRSSKSRAANFFIAEALFLNLRITAWPKGGISRYLNPTPPMGE